ncbi:MAG: QueT transporter family protein [Clostridiales bacterium]|nr:QueT transporter family protein [Clostridiales bacterium]
MLNKNKLNIGIHPISSAKKIAVSGIVIAIYIVLMYLTQSFAFGQYQIRIATSIYALAAIHPFLILPMGIANLLSNTIMGGLGPLDMFGGFIAGVLTSLGCWFLKKIHVYLVALPIILIPSLLVPVWLSYLIGVPYIALVISIGIGQILPAIAGVIIIKYLEKPLSSI